ncbi:hypothetical protein D3C76_1522690 [compost metagenome]
MFGRCAVIGCGNDACGVPGTSPSRSQSFEGLRACDLVDEVPVDINQAFTSGILMYNMAMPEFFIKSGGHFHQAFWLAPAPYCFLISASYSPRTGGAVTSIERWPSNVTGERTVRHCP